MVNGGYFRKYLGCFLFAFPLALIFGPLNATETQLIRVRRGDTISYLSFKIYGMYNSKIADLLRRENPQVKDIDLIYAGQQIRFPAPEIMRRTLTEKTWKLTEPEKRMEPKEARPEEKPMPETRVRANQAVITFLEGEVQVKKAGQAQWSPARPNMILYEEDQIKVPAKSRAELILDNQSVLRLAENTLLTIHKLEEETATQKETARMELSLGKLWTRTAKLLNPSSRYEIKTPTAIAGVQGTTYQVQVGGDRSTNIQVFQGMVNVYNPFPAARPALPGKEILPGQPQEVTGPGEVPGPTPVSREEWTKIVLRQFQQVTVTDQDISSPISFDVQKERQNEWVRWNEARDLDFQPPERWR
ncbi:MAG: FecR domain-containing protein [Deltaproteobacteria bacterium]|nr:FecR domain-containing protein [Deltaproteobacteria bacterium]